MPVQPQGRVNYNQLNSGLLGMIPGGIMEDLGGEGILDLIRKIAKPADKVVEDKDLLVTGPKTLDDMSADVIKWAKRDFGDKIKPGLNVFPTEEGAHSLVYGSSKGEPVAVAHVFNGATKGLFADKTKGLLGQKGAMALGKEILKMGAAKPMEGGIISPDTYRLLQHLAKIGGK